MRPLSHINKQVADFSPSFLQFFHRGKLSLGQEVDVFVDSFPGEAFTGNITHISDRAEFTPKNVQTKEERVNTVFAVKIKLDNPDQKLKPGMPADAILSQGQPEL